MVDYENNIEESARLALKKPEDFGYWGSEDMFKTWGFTGHDKSRDAGILDRSNFKVISENLMSEYPEDCRIESYSHWLVGYVERLVCRILLDEDKGIVEDNITDVFRLAMRWQDMLNDYPIADENDWSDECYKDCIETLEGMNAYLLDMIDQSNESWAESVYFHLIQEMDVTFDPDANMYPSDDQILLAVYSLKLWNIEEKEVWDNWTEDSKLEPIYNKDKDKNQLKLFEEF